MTNESLLSGPGLKPIEKFCPTKAENEKALPSEIEVQWGEPPTMNQLTAQSEKSQNVLNALNGDPPDARPSLTMRIWSSIYLAVFIGCWIFIGAVSSIDTGLTVKFHSGLKEHEQNPVARLILAADGWEVSRFVGIKMFGTILVLGILIWLYHIRRQHALLVIATLTVFQGLLLMYLLLF
jgi:hypothetical protein